MGAGGQNAATRMDFTRLDHRSQQERPGHPALLPRFSPPLGLVSDTTTSFLNLLLNVQKVSEPARPKPQLIQELTASGCGTESHTHRKHTHTRALNSTLSLSQPHPLLKPGVQQAHRSASLVFPIRTGLSLLLKPLRCPLEGVLSAFGARQLDRTVPYTASLPLNQIGPALVTEATKTSSCISRHPFLGHYPHHKVWPMCVCSGISHSRTYTHTHTPPSK